MFFAQVVTWSGSIEVGVTSLDPSNLEFPASATQLCDGSWVLSGSTVLHNGEAIVDEYNCDLDSCNIGDRVGVQRNSQGELRIYLNGEDRGVAATGIPSKIYAVIDLYGKCTEVTIVNADTSKSGGVYRRWAVKTISLHLAPEHVFAIKHQRRTSGVKSISFMFQPPGPQLNPQKPLKAMEHVLN